jgi:hypothetical protein
MGWGVLGMSAAVMAVYMPFCAAEVRQAAVPPDAPLASLWHEPADLGSRDLYAGPWGQSLAPDPGARYLFVERKRTGNNPGMTVRDPLQQEWSVKQGSEDGYASEGQIEVVLSRVLSAVGYYQPPVYYLPSFTLVDDWGSHTEPGGRFRLKAKALKDRGEWSWQQNPFVGTPEYQGLLVILLTFNSTDLKNSNNTVYHRIAGEETVSWFVVRDLGSALGTTGRLAPARGDATAFARSRFITGVRDGFVEFDYHGWHQELVERRITPRDVAWASRLLSRLTAQQWADAFRAGGYPAATSAEFIGAIQRRIQEGQRIGAADPPPPVKRGQ